MRVLGLPPWMSNPAVTFRISPEDLRKLERLENRTGQSRGSLLRENLGIAVRDADAAFERGRSVGRREGNEAGRRTGFEEGVKAGKENAAYVLRIPCPRCGKTVDLDFVNDKGANQTYWLVIRDVIKPAGWGHSKCPT
jgi:hypothetical protein